MMPDGREVRQLAERAFRLADQCRRMCGRNEEDAAILQAIYDEVLDLCATLYTMAREIAP